ncbi:hypothetical protein GF374_03635 [Candidatus Woesearchaeota archaeon]|nr:hypothetical protein [Candidatus Woesearchaeota archaeon]
MADRAKQSPNVITTISAVGVLIGMFLGAGIVLGVMQTTGQANKETLQRVSERAGDHEIRITTLETRYMYIQRQLDAIADAVGAPSMGTGQE